MANLPPSYDDVYNEFNQSHIAQFGVPFNRSFNSDQGARDFGNQVQAEYDKRLQQFNQQNGTNLTEPPSFTKNWQQWNDAHIARFGIPMDRAWNADQGAADVKNSLDQQWQQQLAQYNQQNGTQLQVNPDMLGPQNQAGAGFLAKAQKSSGLGGSLLGSIAGIALAPYTGGSSLLMGGLGGAIGGGIQGGDFQSALKGGLLGSGLGYGAGAIGLGEAAAGGLTDAASGAIGAGDLGTTIGAEGLGGFDFGGAGFGELGSGSFGAAENLANSTSMLSNTGGALGSGLAGTAGAGSPLLGETAFGIAGADSSWGANPLARLLNLGKTGSDALQVGGNLLGAGLGAYGANQQAQSYGDIANKFMDMGAPYRGLLADSYKPGFSMANQPDFMNALDIGSQAAARATSAKSGNPVGNPGAYADMQKYISGSLALPQLNTYRSQLGTFGQLGTNQAGSAMGNQVQAQGGVYDALGYGIGQATQPDNPYKGLLDQLKGFKLNNGGSFA